MRVEGKVMAWSGHLNLALYLTTCLHPTWLGPCWLFSLHHFIFYFKIYFTDDSHFNIYGTSSSAPCQSPYNAPHSRLPAPKLQGRGCGPTLTMWYLSRRSPSMPGHSRFTVCQKVWMNRCSARNKRLWMLHSQGAVSPQNKKVHRGRQTRISQGFLGS